MTRLPPLAQAKCTIRRADPRLVDLPHVTEMVSGYLDGSVLLSPPQAASQKSPALLDRVLTRVMNDVSVNAAVLSHWLARAMEIAIKQDNLVLVQQIHHVHSGPLCLHSLQLALQYGSLEMVEWIVANRTDGRCCAPGLERLCHACLTAALPPRFAQPDPSGVLDWILDSGVVNRILGTGMYVRALHGMVRHASVLQWLDERYGLQALSTCDILTIPIEDGPVESIDAVRYVIDSGVTIDDDTIMGSLIRGACQQQLEPLIDVVVASRLCDSFRDKFVWAATRPGGAKVLQWDAAFMTDTLVYGNMSTVLYGSQPMTHSLSWHAAYFGHVDTAKWLWHERGVAPMNVRICEPHSEDDLLTLYQWMLDKHVDGWEDGRAVVAASKGYITVLQWLQEHKPDQFSNTAMLAAARHGQLHAIQWLHSNRSEGCTSMPLTLASRHGHLDVVQYLSKNCTEGNTNEAMLHAVLGGQFDVLVWLQANRIDSCSPCVLQSVLHIQDADHHANISLDAIRWLTLSSASYRPCAGQCSYSGHQVGPSLAAVALGRGDLAMARYLFEHHRSAFAVSPVDPVVQGGHLPAVQWLRATAPESVGWAHTLEVARELRVQHIVEWLETAN